MPTNRAHPLQTSAADPKSFVRSTPTLTSCPLSTRRESSHRLATVSGTATCPGALIVHADGTVMVCTKDEEPVGCRGRDLRHEGDPVRCLDVDIDGVQLLRRPVSMGARPVLCVADAGVEETLGRGARCAIQSRQSVGSPHRQST
jgi:hypothetical protein